MSDLISNLVAALRAGIFSHPVSLKVSTFIFILSVFLGILSIANKLLLLANRRAGWTSGMVIGLLSSVFFFFIGLKILAFAELGFFVVMLYGYASNTKRSNVHECMFDILLTCISLVLSIALFKGQLTIYELISSLSFIWGGYALAVANRFLGWSLLLSAHVATSLASYLAGELVFAGLQILSGIVCVFALITLLAHRRSEERPVGE
jgi:hypothetical protein